MIFSSVTLRLKAGFFWLDITIRDPTLGGFGDFGPLSDGTFDNI